MNAILKFYGSPRKKGHGKMNLGRGKMKIPPSQMKRFKV